MLRTTLISMAALLATAAPLSAAVKTGSPVADAITGTSRADVIATGLGNDTLAGRGGGDRMSGGKGGDVLVGGAGGDRMLGGAGADRLAGGAGHDRLVGGTGRDRLVGGRGGDVLIAGPGNDRVLARDGRRDRIRCGAGRDTVVADAVDRVASDCERVRTGSGGHAARPEGAGDDAVLNPAPPEYAAGRAGGAVPLGRWATLYDAFAVRVDAPGRDATAEVLAAHPFNDPPAPGHISFMTEITVTFNGEGEASFDAAVRLGVWDPATGRVWRADEDECGLLPRPLDDSFLSSGQSASGQVCWSIPAEAAPRVVMVDDELTQTPSTMLAVR